MRAHLNHSMGGRLLCRSDGAIGVGSQQADFSFYADVRSYLMTSHRFVFGGGRGWVQWVCLGLNNRLGCSTHCPESGSIN